MLHLLWFIESKIKLRQSRPQPEPLSLIGYFWPQNPGQNRKANELEATGDTRIPPDSKRVVTKSERPLGDEM